MKYMRGIVAKHPAYAADHNGELVACIEACLNSAAAASACADACLGEEHSEQMATCIRLNLNCSELCAATASMLTRNVGHLTQAAVAQVNALAVVALAAAVECGQMADKHEHCAICAQALRSLIEACRHLAGRSAEAKTTERGVDQEAALH